MWPLKLAAHSNSSGIANAVNAESGFVPYLYTGNGTSMTINNGLNFSGTGGVVFTSARSGAFSVRVTDTINGTGKYMTTASTAAIATDVKTVTAFNSNGYSIGAAGAYNTNGSAYVSWSFTKTPRFFDMVTYTGNGVARTIPHNLGTVPGMIIVKRTDNTGNWYVYHASLGPTQVMTLEGTSPTSSSPAWNNTSPTSSVFSVTSSSAGTNISGATYVAYLFAHDTSSGGAIQCGSYVGNGGSTGPVINLGWEPQFLLIKNSTGVGNWYVFDQSRGLTINSTNDLWLTMNQPNAETAGTFLDVNSTGFKVNDTTATFNINSSTYVYMAIRRPTKLPTVGTQVYNALHLPASTTTGIGFPADMVMAKAPNSVQSWLISDRLRSTIIYSDTTDFANAQFSGAGPQPYDTQDGVRTYSMPVGSYDYHMFRRYKGVFDIVCDQGTGATHSITHQLGVVPELIIRKCWNNGGFGWPVYAAPVGNINYMLLNDSALPTSNGTMWNNTTPSATTFTVGTNSTNNGSTNFYVTYLFATLAGISKVGSYTGNGTSQTIDCGFTTGARFILIKRFTNTTGDWQVWNSVRGINNSATEAYLKLNTSKAEVTTEDVIDNASSGFIVKQTASNMNVNGSGYLFLAIA